ncbi:MAG TPA: tetratricopeptide repeat protein [Chthonomonas sp.]|uniref:tetratricopeptide repeat protein n=1 Tax=Chthonomonas sp. TaxID=2282153 RepID=UPI002B4ACB6C|nr:tetratricopeptide repeat protein [Chthonomonas sp.]HLI50034.1 tetratricopeptide repeat protein [Chthonomonas sp.]
MKRALFAFAIILIGLGGLATLLFFSDFGHRFWLHHLSLPSLLRYTIRHENDPDAFVELAARMEIEGHYEEALQDYIHATQLQSANKTAWLGAVRCAQRTRDMSNAFALATQMTQALPRSSAAWSTLADLYLQTGDRIKAIDAFRHALSLNPHDAEAQYGLSKALFQQGDLQHALSAAQKAVALSTNRLSYLLNLATILQQMGRFTEAKTVLQKAHHLSPHNPEVLAAEGTLLAISSTSPTQQETAIRLLKAAIERLNDPKTAYAASYQLGQLYLLTNKLPDAEQAFRHALQLNPNDTQALFALGRTLALEGKPSESKATLERFYKESQFRLKLSQLLMRIGRQPNSALLWNRLALLYASHHNWTEAQLAAQRSLQLQPHQPELKQLTKIWPAISAP